MDDRRDSGTFFTGSVLAQKAIGPSAVRNQSATFFDPTCGAGDLLLAAANKLPVEPSLSATLDAWGTRLAGCESHVEFVRAAKARLALLAMLRGAKPSTCDPINLNAVLPLIRVGDSLFETTSYADANWIVVNPPYGYITAPPDCTWASGQITAAALFFEKCLQNCKAGASIIAILPEVLRAGSRYKR